MGERVSVIGRIFATTSLKRLFLASLTIVAILLGLIGMHALSAGTIIPSSQVTYSQTSTAHHVGTQMTSDSTESAPPAIHTVLLLFVGLASFAVVSAQGCVGMCAMNCLLLGMVCALSFLVALIGLSLGKLPSPRVFTIRKATRILRIAISKLVLPSTPSINALSISRT